MRRILPIVWPTVRMTRGRSLGGITAKATMPTRIILLMSRSNMAHRTGRPTAGQRAASPSLKADVPVEARSANLVNVVRVNADPVLQGSRRALGGGRLVI